MEARAHRRDLEPGERAGRGLLFGCFAALLVLSVVAGAGVSYLPTNDGPRHLFAIHAAAHLDDDTTGWGRYFASETPVTSHGFGVLFGPLDHWLPWQLALRASLALMLMLWVGGAFLFVYTLHPARAWLGLVLGAAAFQWTLYMGFFSFYIATAMGLFVLAFAIRQAERSPENPRLAARQQLEGHLLLGVLLGCQALLHVVAAALTGLVVAFLLIGCAPARSRLRAAFHVVCLGLPAGIVAAWVLLADIGASPADLPQDADSTPWWAYGRCLMGGPGWRAWPVTLLALLGLLLAPLSSRPVDRALWSAGGALALLAWLLPLHIPSWHFVSVRVLPGAACVLVALLPVERIRAPRLGAAVSASALLFALASTAWAYHYNRDLEARSADALSGLSRDLKRSGPRLPINLDPGLGRSPTRHGDMPYAVPLANLGHLYALDQGGTLPHNFAVIPTLHHLRLHVDAYRRYPAIPADLYAWAEAVYESSDATRRAAIVTDAARYGAFYEDVVIWGDARDIDLLAHRGYEIDWRQGGFALARFRGCVLRVEIEEPPPLAASAALEIGWYPLDATGRRVPLPTRDPRKSSLQLEVSRAPCGAVWLRVTEGKRGAARTAFRCEGADSQDRLVVHSLVETPVVRCRVGSAPPALAAAS